MILLGLLGAWEWAARGFGLSELVLPAPSRVVQSLWTGLSTGFLWPHIGQTVFELLAGLLVGAGFGFGVGVLLGESVFLRRIAMPYIVTSQVLPKLALAPLLIVWLGFGALPIVVITALICFFPLLENTMTAVQQTDPNRLELFRMLGASRWQTLWRLKIPAGLPGILAGLRIAVVLALVGAVVAEFIGASQGLGALIIAAQGSMDTPMMFSVLLLITVIGLLSYQCTAWLESRLLKTWRMIE
jgi:NitT/TauT family transport system permease protein